MKLLVDPSTQSVVFAEVGKDVVDFIFTLLSLPLGTVTKLLSKDRMVGSIRSVYASIESLDPTYMQPDQSKAAFLCPPTSLLPSLFRPLLPSLLPDQSSSPKRYYTCWPSHGNKYYTDVSGATCPSCGQTMTEELSYKEGHSESVGSGGGRGVVKDAVVYMVMDDLSVAPMSIITVLSKFAKDLAKLEVRNADLGLEEGLKMLKASLESKTVLTDVFIAENRLRQGSTRKKMTMTGHRLS